MCCVRRRAHTRPQRRREGDRRYDANSRTEPRSKITLSSERGVGLARASAGMGSPRILEISRRLWRTTSWSHKRRTSMCLVRCRPKRPATAFAVKMSTHTYILSSHPGSRIAASIRTPQQLHYGLRWCGRPYSHIHRGACMAESTRHIPPAWGRPAMRAVRADVFPERCGTRRIPSKRRVMDCASPQSEQTSTAQSHGRSLFALRRRPIRNSAL